MKKVNNGQLTIKNVGDELELYGWVQKKRDLGGVVFIDLRDRTGIVQLVARDNSSFYEMAASLKSESVIKVIGVVSERESKNKNIYGGVNYNRLGVKSDPRVDALATIMAEVENNYKTRKNY